MIFLDTSAIYALADREDANHARSVEILGRISAAGERLVTHNYVLVESIALLQARLGARAAVELTRSTKQFTVHWVDAPLHAAAASSLEATPRRRISFVDRVSFAVMRQRGVATYFAFDDDFRREGFEPAFA